MRVRKVKKKKEKQKAASEKEREREEGFDGSLSLKDACAHVEEDTKDTTIIHGTKRSSHIHVSVPFQSFRDGLHLKATTSVRRTNHARVIFAGIFHMEDARHTADRYPEGRLVAFELVRFASPIDIGVGDGS